MVSKTDTTAVALRRILNKFDNSRKTNIKNERLLRLIQSRDFVLKAQESRMLSDASSMTVSQLCKYIISMSKSSQFQETLLTKFLQRQEIENGKQHGKQSD